MVEAVFGAGIRQPQIHFSDAIASEDEYECYRAAFNSTSGHLFCLESEYCLWMWHFAIAVFYWEGGPDHDTLEFAPWSMVKNLTMTLENLDFCHGQNFDHL